MPHPIAAGDSARVAASGELDIATVPSLDGDLRRAEARADRVVLDLREVEFVDSSAAHLILAADRRIRRAGGELVVLLGSPEVQWFFALIGLDRELQLVARPPADADAVLA